MAQKYKYCIVGITFPYDTRYDDVVDELISTMMRTYYEKYDYLGSENDGTTKTSQYIMKYYKELDDKVWDKLHEIVDMPEIDMLGVHIDLSFMSEKVAKNEGYV